MFTFFKNINMFGAHVDYINMRKVGLIEELLH